MEVAKKNSKIKVLHVISGLGTGGAETMLYKILSSTDRLKFDHAVVSLSNEGTHGDKIGKLGFQVFPFHLNRPRSLFLKTWKQMTMCKQYQPDVIMGWMYHGCLVAYWLRKILFPYSKVIWNIRCSWDEMLLRKKMNRWVINQTVKLSKKPDLIISNSTPARMQHIEHGYSNKNFEVIPNGFDTSQIYFSEEKRQEFRELCGFTDEHFVIGMVARFDPFKDYENFFKAAKITIQRNKHVRFIAVGPRVDHSNKELVSMMRRNGLQGKVRLLGEQKDVWPIYCGMDLVTLTSKSEGFPNVIGEAMACEVPCVATDVGETGRLIGTTGIVVPPQNSKALAEAFENILNLHESERRQLGKQARKRIEENFDLLSITGQFEKECYKLLQQQ